MMLTLLLSIAIAALALLMLRQAYAGVYRDYIRQRQRSARTVVPVGMRTFPPAMSAAPLRRA
jgi:hypothetical protein